jgi:hypothetical protein
MVQPLSPPPPALASEERVIFCGIHAQRRSALFPQRIRLGADATSLSSAND